MSQFAVGDRVSYVGASGEIVTGVVQNGGSDKLTRILQYNGEIVWLPPSELAMFAVSGGRQRTERPMSQFAVGDRVKYSAGTGTIEVVGNGIAQVLLDGSDYREWVLFKELTLIGVGGGGHPAPVPNQPPSGPVPGGWGWSGPLLLLVAIVTGIWQVVTWPFRAIRRQFDTD